MLTDPLQLKDFADSTQGFTRISSLQGGSDWVEDDATISDKRTIAVRHSNAGKSSVKGGPPLRRHLMQFTHSKWNATLGITEKLVANVTFTCDPSTSFDTTDYADIGAFISNAFGNGAETILDQLLRDET